MRPRLQTVKRASEHRDICLRSHGRHCHAEQEEPFTNELKIGSVDKDLVRMFSVIQVYGYLTVST